MDTDSVCDTTTLKAVDVTHWICVAGDDPNRVITGTITEDMPLWNCSTMGNQICGPLPDTAMAPPGPDLTGIAVLLVIFMAALTGRIKER